MTFQSYRNFGLAWKFVAVRFNYNPTSDIASDDEDGKDASAKTWADYFNMDSTQFAILIHVTAVATTLSLAGLQVVAGWLLYKKYCQAYGY